MGLYPVKIQFEKELPSFQSISQQYKRQTGLTIRLVAIVHLATGEVGELLRDSSTLFPALQADAAAFATLDAKYEAEKTPLISTNQYEKAAVLRDRIKQEKERLNHIAEVLVMVGYDLDFHLIEFYMEGQIITVNKYINQHYAVDSFIKSLVDLGGKCRFNGKDELPKSWLNLKQWDDYKWYNRPKK